MDHCQAYRRVASGDGSTKKRLLADADRKLRRGSERRAENPLTRHVARALLIGVYTGTRPGAIFALKWLPTPMDGWFDLESGVLHRKGHQRRASRASGSRLRGSTRGSCRTCDGGARPTWREASPASCTIRAKKSPSCVDPGVRWRGSPAPTAEDGPHIMRHTAATWQMQAGTDIYQAAGYLGMSAETLLGGLRASSSRLPKRRRARYR